MRGFCGIYGSDLIVVILASNLFPCSLEVGLLNVNFGKITLSLTGKDLVNDFASSFLGNLWRLEYLPLVIENLLLFI